MSQRSGIFLAMLVCALLAVVVFYFMESGDKVYGTPQEVFDASRAALSKNDMRAWCACLTDDSRDLIAAKLAIHEFTAKQQFEKAGTAEQKAKIRAVDKVLAQYGLTDETLSKLQEDAVMLMDPRAPMKEQVALAQELLKSVDDRNGFIADMFGALLQGAKEGNPFVEELKDATLTDLQVSGKTAQGVITQKGGQGGASKLSFRKQGEGWRIDLFADMAKQPAGPRGFQHP